MNKSGLWESLRSIKHIEWIAVLLIAGAAIMVISTWMQSGEPPPSVETMATASPAASGSLESRMEATLSLIDGAGRVRVLVHREEAAPASVGSTGAITGVIVVADGADDLSVRLELARAVQSLLDVPQKNIEIFAMAKESEE